ncbi:MAG: proliferating cell nuclear antigen (pcna) [Acidithiobacillus sp.]|jgi:proliferating cell nuclear antigen|uniref:proliferating cell nuclear antigen (pcna) n=1 Tax=Acidithiobacillus sp. TaxID=1872118 RepID=UPI00355EB6E7
MENEKKIKPTKENKKKTSKKEIKKKIDDDEVNDDEKSDEDSDEKIDDDEVNDDEKSDEDSDDNDEKSNEDSDNELNNDEKSNKELSSESVSNTNKIDELSQMDLSPNEKCIIEFKDAKIMKGIMDSIGEIISEIILIIRKNIGLEILAMDLAHICLVRLLLKKEDLNQFVCSNTFKMGINLIDFNKLLKRASNDDIVTLIREPRINKILLQMKPKESKRARKFNIALIEMEGEPISFESINNIEFTSIFTMNIKHIDEAIKDAEIFHEAISIGIKDKILSFSTMGIIGDMEYTLEPTELKNISVMEENTENTIYSISFLKNILKIINTINTIKISMGYQFPLKMDLKCFSQSELTYVLAPRVVEDEQENYE